MQKRWNPTRVASLRRQGSHTPPALSHSRSRVFKKLKKYPIARARERERGREKLSANKDWCTLETSKALRFKFQATNTSDLETPWQNVEIKCVFGRGCNSFGVGLTVWSGRGSEAIAHTLWSRAAEDPVLRQKRREGRGVPGLPCGQRPLWPQAELQGTAHTH